MVKDKTTQHDGLSYLETVAYDNAEDALVAPAEFEKLTLTKPPANFFNADSFPEKNIASFKFIPLNLNPHRRMMYLQPYAGGSAPPDCSSADGINPTQPLDFNGVKITSCLQCPLHGFGKNFKCHDSPSLVGLAYFPEYNDLLVPIRKDIPTKSIKAFNGMLRKLSVPVSINGAVRTDLPHWARIITVSSEEAPSNYGPISVFTFEVSDTEFVPEHLVDQIRELFGVAKAYTARQSVPALAAGPSAGMLTSGEQPGVAPDSSLIDAAEGEADY